MIKPVDKQPSELIQFQFKGFPLGENLEVPASQLLPQELSSCIDMKIKRGGRLETREPFTLYSDTEIGSIVDMESCSINGTQRDLVSDDDGKIYYLVNNTAGTGVTPTQIGTSAVGTTAYFMPYNDVALIMDGSYLKYCNSVTAIKMAYDDGTDGAFFNNYSGDQDSTIAITTAGVGCTFTTPAWDAGFTIPPTKAYFHVQATTAGAATITAVIKDTAGATVASAAYASTIPTTAASMLNVTFTSPTSEFEPLTKYYCVLKGSNVNLTYTAVSSGGKLVTAGGATADTAKNPVMRVHPGLPPKASFGAVSGNRPFIVSATVPGRVYFGNLTHLDWSTSNGGGWVGVVDDSANSFEVGGIKDLYGNLYVCGKEDQPFICQLIGSTPSDYSLPLLFQKSWTTHRTLVNTNNDLWSASSTGVDPLTGVQEYGDLRTFSASDPVASIIEDNWSTSTAFAGYHAKDGQYWLYMPGYSYFMVCHTKIPVRMDSGEIRYPWSRYTCPAVPTAIKQVGSRFLIGSSDGFIYQLNSSEYKDLTTDQIEPSFKLPVINMPGRESNLVKIQFSGTSVGGSQFYLDIYKNGLSDESVKQWTVSFPMSDSLTIDDLTMDIDDMLFAISPDQTPLYFDLNINVRSFQIEISEIFISGYPVFFDGITVTAKGLRI